MNGLRIQSYSCLRWLACALAVAAIGHTQDVDSKLIVQLDKIIHSHTDVSRIFMEKHDCDRIRLLAFKVLKHEPAMQGLVVFGFYENVSVINLAFTWIAVV